jgi:predicted peptidase
MAAAFRPIVEQTRMFADEVLKQFETRQTQVGSLSFQARLLPPVSIAPPERYPLIVYLHGMGERGGDNCAQLRFLPEWMAEPARRREFPCYLLAPQCRPDRFWVETPRAFDRSAARHPPGPQMQAVINLLDDVLRELPVDPRRLYLTGLSMGGYGSWDLGTRLANRWAAVAPICGGGDELYADRLVGVPLWAWHGDADEVVPVEKTRRMIEAIRRAGGQPRYTELAGVGHDSWTPAYTSDDGVVPWMFAQRRA